jgi:hypothetical protein
MPLATLTIPLGLTFLAVAALACLIAYANAKTILRPDDDDQREENWTWPER